jgi:lipoate-protein ligase A
MAADLALLDSVAAGAPPVLRLYTWAPPALSLGRFQAADDVDHAACARLGVEVVRRPTGGRALLHGGDLTYAVAVMRPPGPPGSVDAVYSWLSRGIVAGLARIGVEATTARRDGPAGPACFAGQQGADLRVGERKLCGSAQVRRGAVVLQHGSIRCRPLPFDETDLLCFGSRAARREAARALADASVDLHGLGVVSEPHAVAAAVIEGFGEALDLDFVPPIAAPGPHALHLTSRSKVPW